jgi:hypothetical protein
MLRPSRCVAWLLQVDFSRPVPSFAQRMTRKLMQWSLVCALVFSIGAHWPILQSVAWVGMAVSYSQTAPLKEALEKTFDGQHPCQLCDFVQTGKNAEKKQDSKKSPTRLDFWLNLDRAVIYPREVFSDGVFTNPSIAGQSHAPPTPPPRFV